MIEPAQPSVANDASLKSALRKASLRIVPLLAVAYGVAIMDRVNISFASLQMNRDLHFSATVYGFGAGIFFLSYAVCEVPSNLALVHFGARRWLARIMVTWGLLAMAMIFVRTPFQFYAVRFLLGMAEAGFFPGVVFYLMQWFPQETRARAISRFYVSSPISAMVMGAIAGTLLGMQGRLSLAGWQWLFLVEGFPAILLGVVFLIFLPDDPTHAAWLTKSEQTAILKAVPPPASSTHSIGPALRDPRVWLLGLFMFCMLGTNYAFLFSEPAIVQKITGFTVNRTGFVIAAVNLLGALALVANGIVSDRRRAPFAHALPGCFLTAAGFLILGTTASANLAIGAVILINVGMWSMQGPLWAIGTSYFTGRTAAAAIAAINTIAIVGGFVGPYLMGIAKDLTGNYQRGLLMMCPPMLLAAVILLYLRPAKVSVVTAAVPSLP